MAQLKPGVVTGKDYLTLVAAAKAGGYALPAVNVSSSSTINAVLEAAAKNQADVIIQLSNGGAQFYAGQGMKDSSKAKVLGAVSAALHTHLLAEHYGVCVVLHTDHANKSLIPWVDASAGSWRGLLQAARQAVVQLAHARPLGREHGVQPERVRPRPQAHGPAEHEPGDRTRRHRRRRGRYRQRAGGKRRQLASLHPAGGCVAGLRAVVAHRPFLGRRVVRQRAWRLQARQCPVAPGNPEEFPGADREEPQDAAPSR